MGILTRADFARVIDEGGAVLHLGRHIFRKEDIPSDEELAHDHEVRKQVVADSLDVQIANLTAQRAALVRDEELRQAEEDRLKAEAKKAAKSAPKDETPPKE